MDSTSLIDRFKEVPDPRRLQGQRHELSHILLIALMSIMSGYIGYRAIGDFMRRNKEDLLLVLRPKRGSLPSFDVIRSVLIAIDFAKLNDVFERWASQYVEIGEKEWLSMDGKAIGGTVSGGSTLNQRFISLVSLYCSKKQLVIGKALVDNSKESEIPAVCQLIAALDLQGAVFTLDALHCQKKQHRPSLPEAMTT